jgi:hypothetical protein
VYGIPLSGGSNWSFDAEGLEAHVLGSGGHDGVPVTLGSLEEDREACHVQYVLSQLLIFGDQL